MIIAAAERQQMKTNRKNGRKVDEIYIFLQGGEELAGGKLRQLSLDAELFCYRSVECPLVFVLCHLLSITPKAVFVWRKFQLGN